MENNGILVEVSGSEAFFYYFFAGEVRSSDALEAILLRSREAQLLKWFKIQAMKSNELLET